MITTGGIFLLVGVFYLLVFVVLFRYYLLFGLREYLLSSVIFLLLTVNGLAISYAGLGTFIENISVLLAIIFLLLVTKRTLSQQYQPFYYLLISLITILAVVDITLLGRKPGYFQTTRILMFELIRGLVGFYLIYAYSHITLVLETRRTRTVKYSWILSGGIMLSTSLIRIVDVLFYSMRNDLSSLSADAPEIMISLVIISLGALGLSVITGVVALFYPELFLLSKFQLVELERLYDLSELINQEGGIDYYPFSQESLLQYLEQVQQQLHKDPADQPKVAKNN